MAKKYLDYDGLLYFWGKIKAYVDSHSGGGGGVTGVKGDAETTYRTGNVNITAANIGGVTGVKGGSESSYRTGNVNLTAANIGAITQTITSMADGEGVIDIGSLHIEWGLVSITTGTTATNSLYSGSATVTYASSYKYIPCVMATWVGNYANQHSVNVVTGTKTGNTIYGRTSTSGATRTIRWLAIGQKA